MTLRYLPPTLLTREHDTTAFASSSGEQNQWLQKYALQSHTMGSTRTMVVCQPGSTAVTAYYAWRMSDISFDSAPRRLQIGTGHYAQPMVLLARLAVDAHHEGHGLGSALLRDAITRMLLISHDIGCRGMLINAESQGAKGFYTHLFPGISELPTDTLTLVLLEKDARQALL
jgi:GNAT superfamily N-acetyltransferase